MVLQDALENKGETICIIYKEIGLLLFHQIEIKLSEHKYEIETVLIISIFKIIKFYFIKNNLLILIVI